MKFEDIKKFFFKKPKNELEGDGEATASAIPEKLATKCEKCKQIILCDELAANQYMCPKCGFYHKMGARERISFNFDGFEELFAEVTGENLLQFPGYDEKLEKSRAASSEKEAVVCGTAFSGGHKAAVFAMDPRFMMGSMGHAVGEKSPRCSNTPRNKNFPSSALF